MNPFEYIEMHPEVLFAVFLLIAVYNGILFFFGGRAAEKRFQGQRDQKILFRERGASGHSKRSMRTRLGGASRVLEVVVTDTELWIKGIWPLFSYIGAKHDLTHRVPISAVRKVRPSNSVTEIWFTNEGGAESHVELRLKDGSAFLQALGAQQSAEANV